MAEIITNVDGTSSECFYWVNNLINIDYIKIDTDLNLDFEDAMKKANKMQTSTTLFKNFMREDDTEPSILAKYFSPEATESGASFTIYRKTPEQKYYNYVCSLKDGAYQFLDYNVVNNQHYHYMAWVEVLKSETEVEYTCYEDIGDNGNVKYIGTSFDRWTICDIEESDEDGVYTKTGNLWALGLNMDNPEFSHNLSITTWDTLGKYGKVSMGSKNYDSSSFTGLLGDMKEYIIYDIPEHGELVSSTPPSSTNNLTKAKDSIDKDLRLLESNLLIKQRDLEIATIEGNEETIRQINDEIKAIHTKMEQLRISLINLEKDSSITNSNYILYQKLNKQVYRYTEKMDLRNPYARETEKLKSWKEFCANGNLKLLRDMKGHAWIVQIIDSPKNTISLGDNINQTTISFSWQEIEDVNDYSIVTIL